MSAHSSPPSNQRHVVSNSTSNKGLSIFHVTLPLKASYWHHMWRVTWRRPLWSPSRSVSSMTWLTYVDARSLTETKHKTDDQAWHQNNVTSATPYPQKPHLRWGKSPFNSGAGCRCRLTAETCSAMQSGKPYSIRLLLQQQSTRTDRERCHVRSDYEQITATYIYYIETLLSCDFVCLPASSESRCLESLRLFSFCCPSAVLFQVFSTK